MMENSRKARERAEAALSGPPERPAKGSAVGIIAAESLATQEKTARLKKLRMERDAAEAPKVVKAKTTKAKAKTTASKPRAKKSAG
ncbi:hypothetical protein [Aurantimonas sp. A3-2-R12]|uniref:hypothetical protein n=1 Tax=Aurantimonas sp. A3-2-R12 TaxID=3114362 RepID=UPI002E1771A2|nr:hypothetical protein [Aurantimonas sp. A3-2-R12]